MQRLVFIVLLVCSVLVLIAAPAHAEKLKARHYKQHKDTMGVVLLEVNWGRAWGCGGLDNAQLAELQFEKTPVSEAPADKFSAITLKPASRLFVKPEYLSYGFIVQPGEYALTKIRIKLARSLKDIVFKEANKETLVEGDSYPGGVIRVGAGEAVYVGHFDLDCQDSPILWRYYPDSWELFQDSVAKYRDKYRYLSEAEIQFRLFDTDNFGYDFELPAGPVETVFVESEDADTWVRGCGEGNGEAARFVIYVPAGSECGSSEEQLLIVEPAPDLALERESLQTIFERGLSRLPDSGCIKPELLLDSDKELMWAEDPEHCLESDYSYRISKLLLGRDEIHLVVYENSGSSVTDETRERWLKAIRNSYVEKNRERVFPDD